MEPEEEEVMVRNFLEFTGDKSYSNAKQFLQVTGWELQEALQLFFAASPVQQDSIKSPEINKQAIESESEQPLALMYRGSFEKAKEAASFENKWLIVNLQSTTEISSHVLNRYTWSNQALAQVISTSFIFWQVTNHNVEWQKVCNSYLLDSFPSILVIDPISGRKLRSWNGMVDADCLLDGLVIFMEDGPKNRQLALSHTRSDRNKEDEKVIILDDDDVEVMSTIEEEEEDGFEDNILAMATSFETSHTVEVKEVQIDMEEEKKEVQIDMEKEKKVEKKLTYVPHPEEYLPLPEESKIDKSLLCRVAIRLPDGRRYQRSFLFTDPVQLLWSFCGSLLHQSEQSFQLTVSIPGESKYLDYHTMLTFEESGLADTLVSVIWD